MKLVLLINSIATASLLLARPLTTIAGPASQTTVDENGTVHVPSFAVPLSSYMSDQAKRSFVEEAREAAADKLGRSASIAEIRQSIDKTWRKQVGKLESLYPVNVEEQRIGGVRIHVVTPREGISVHHRDRVLINLHGGGFQVGAVWGALVESIPVASVGNFRVITVDYRCV